MRFEESAEAAVDLVAALGEIESSGRNLVTALLGTAPFVAFEHYPPDDVRDKLTGAQYYFHAHRGRIESGHIHCFLRRKSKAGMTHVVAIGLDDHGRPARMFTTNRWVTNDDYVPADRLIPQLHRMAWPDAPGDAGVNKALGALFRLYRPQLAALLRRRDRRLALHAARIAPRDPKADEGLEILSTMRIDLPATLARLRARLERMQGG
ncbi:MAG: hypothetical protein B7Z59_10235 [Acidiphilium sp. 37-67-22]|nr:MAG: hypothetical protein B7Z59_10235 [Acidiphilium sp. 37-67-22]